MRLRFSTGTCCTCAEEDRLLRVILEQFSYSPLNIEYFDWDSRYAGPRIVVVRRED